MNFRKTRRILSIVLALLVVAGGLVYTQISNVSEVQAVEYRGNSVADSGYKLIDSFEGLGGVSPNGQRTLTVGYATEGSSVGGISGALCQADGSIPDQPSYAEKGFLPLKGEHSLRFSTYYSGNLPDYNPNIPQSVEPTAYGLLSYKNAIDLSKYDYICMGISLDCTNVNADTGQNIPLTIRFGNAGSEDGWGYVANINHLYQDEWRIIKIPLKRGQTNYAVNEGYNGAITNVALDMTKIQSISLRVFGNQTKQWGWVNIYIDYIYAYCDDFTGPTVESFDSLGQAGDDVVYSNRIGMSARGWNVDGSEVNGRLGINSTTSLVREGTGCLHLQQYNILNSGNNHSGQTWGPQTYVRFRTPMDFTDYDYFELELYFNGIGSYLRQYNACLMINLISSHGISNQHSTEDDGFNYQINFNSLEDGKKYIFEDGDRWNTIRINKSDFTKVMDGISWSHIDGITFRIYVSGLDRKPIFDAVSNQNCSTTGLNMCIDDFRAERKEDVYIDDDTIRLTNMTQYDFYGYSNSNMKNVALSDSNSDKPVDNAYGTVMTFAADTANNEGVNRWKFHKFHMPTARDLRGYKYVVVELYLNSVPTSGELHMRINRDRYYSDQIPLYLVSGSVGFQPEGTPHLIKKGWNKLYFDIEGAKVATGSGINPFGWTKDEVLKSVRNLRFSYVDLDSKGQDFSGKICEIYATKKVLTEDKMPMVDSFVQGSSRNFVSQSTGTTVSLSSLSSIPAPETQNTINEKGAVIKAWDNSGIHIVTAANQSAVIAGQNDVNTSFRTIYNQPKDFRGYSTIEIKMYVAENLPHEGTFEINLFASSYDSNDVRDAYNCRLDAKLSIKQGWNVVRFNRYDFMPSNCLGGTVAMENADYADWANIWGWRIIYYSYDGDGKTSAIDWYIDSIYATNYHYYEDAKSIETDIRALYTDITTKFNTPDDFNNENKMIDRYEALDAQMKALNNNNKWKSFDPERGYYGETYGVNNPISSTSSPVKKVNDGFNYDLLEYSGDTYKNEWNRIQQEIEKSASMSQTVKRKSGKYYESFTTDVAPNITDNSSFTICYTLKRDNSYVYYDGALDSGIDPWIYFYSVKDGQNIVFPVGTRITLRRVGTNFYQNYHYTVSSPTESFVKFSQFRTMDKNSSSTYWNDFNTSFPAKGSSYTYLIIVDMAHVTTPLSSGQYDFHVWSGATGTDVGIKGNSYVGFGHQVVEYASSGFSVTASRVGSETTISPTGKMTIEGNITTGAIDTNAEDSYNQNRNVTLVVELTDSSNVRQTIPKGTKITVKQNGTQTNSSIRVNNQVFTNISVDRSVKSAQSIPYTIEFDFSTAAYNEVLALTDAVGNDFKVRVTAYSGYDINHPCSGDKVVASNIDGTAFNIKYVKFSAVLSDNNQTLVKREGGVQTMTFNIGKATGLSDFSVKMYLQQKQADGTYSTVNIDQYATVGSAYATLNGPAFDLNLNGITNRLDVAVDGSKFTTGTYRICFECTEPNGLMEVDNTYIGFVVD